MERNRWMVLLASARLRTLLVLAVPLLAAEVALLLVALRGGWLREKLRAWLAAAQPRSWRYVARGRARQRRLRAVGDREVYSAFTTALRIEPPWLGRAAGAALGAIRALARRLVR
jgi:hypothetical protein